MANYTPDNLPANYKIGDTITFDTAGNFDLSNITKSVARVKIDAKGGMGWSYGNTSYGGQGGYGGQTITELPLQKTDKLVFDFSQNSAGYKLTPDSYEDGPGVGVYLNDALIITAGGGGGGGSVGYYSGFYGHGGNGGHGGHNPTAGTAGTAGNGSDPAAGGAAGTQSHPAGYGGMNNSSGTPTSHAADGVIASGGHGGNSYQSYGGGGGGGGYSMALAPAENTTFNDGTNSNNTSLTLTVLDVVYYDSYTETTTSDFDYGTNESVDIVNDQITLVDKDISMISQGSNYSLALKNDGTVWSVGYNNYGQLGLGDTSTRSTYIKIPGLSNIKKVIAGTYSSFAIDENNVCYAWGYNPYGQLGDGTTTQQNSPIQVMTDVLDVFSGNTTTGFIKTDNTLWMVGYNYYGQLGNGNTTTQYSPVQVTTNVVSGSVSPDSYSTTLIIKTDGYVYATGYNGYGQLGLGNTTNYSTFQKTSIGNAKKVVCIEMSNLILTNDGYVYGAGRNDYGCLGLGNTTAQHSFTRASINSVIDVDGGNYFQIALKNDGTVWGVGYNNYGTLGNGNTTNQSTYVKSNATNIKSISVYTYSSQAFANDGHIYGAGFNSYYQLGDGISAANQTSYVESTFVIPQKSLSGYHITPPVYFTDTQTAVSWTSDEPTGTSITVQSSVDGGTTWDNVTKGQKIPNFTDATNQTVQLKATLSRNDYTVDPVLYDITAAVQQGAQYTLTATSNVSINDTIKKVAKVYLTATSNVSINDISSVHNTVPLNATSNVSVNDLNSISKISHLNATSNVSVNDVTTTDKQVVIDGTFTETTTADFSTGTLVNVTAIPSEMLELSRIVSAPADSMTISNLSSPVWNGSSTSTPEYYGVEFQVNEFVIVNKFNFYLTNQLGSASTGNIYLTDNTNNQIFNDTVNINSSPAWSSNNNPSDITLYPSTTYRVYFESVNYNSIAQVNDTVTTFDPAFTNIKTFTSTDGGVTVSYDGSTNPAHYFAINLTKENDGYATSGYRITPVYKLLNNFNTISWNLQPNDGCTFAMEYSIDSGNTWITVNNGDILPDNCPAIQFKQSFTSSNPKNTADLTDMTLKSVAAAHTNLSATSNVSLNDNQTVIKRVYMSVSSDIIVNTTNTIEKHVYIQNTDNVMIVVENSITKFMQLQNASNVALNVTPKIWRQIALQTTSNVNVDDTRSTQTHIYINNISNVNLNDVKSVESKAYRHINSNVTVNTTSGLEHTVPLTSTSNITLSTQVDVVQKIYKQQIDNVNVQSTHSIERDKDKKSFSNVSINDNSQITTKNYLNTTSNVSLNTVSTADLEYTGTKLTRFVETTTADFDNGINTNLDTSNDELKLQKNYTSLITSYPNTYAAMTGLAESARGIEIIPNKNLTISQFKVYLPAVNSSVTLAIWDTATRTLIHSEVVNYTTAAAEQVFTLSTPITLTSGKTYWVGGSSTEQYYHTNDNSNTPGNEYWSSLISSDIALAFNGTKYMNGTADSAYPDVYTNTKFIGGFYIPMAVDKMTSGTHETQPMYLKTTNTQVVWNDNVPTGTALVIESSVDNGNTWTQIVNGTAIPNFTNSNLPVQFRSTFSSGDGTLTPTLYDFTVYVKYPITTTINMDYEVKATSTLKVEIKADYGVHRPLNPLTIDADYAIHNTLSQDIVANYAVKEPLDVTILADYLVKTKVITLTVKTDYAVRHNLEQKIITDYGVRRPLTPVNATFNYNIHRSVAPINVGIDYNIKRAVQTEIGLSFAIRNKLLQNINTKYAVRRTLNQNVAATYGIHRSIQLDIQNSYAIHRALGTTIDTQYAVKRVLVKDIETAYAIKRELDVQIGLSYKTKATSTLTLPVGVSYAIHRTKIVEINSWYYVEFEYAIEVQHLDATLEKEITLSGILNREVILDAVLNKEDEEI